MKITSILKERDKGFSFEFFPPKTDKGRLALETTVNALKKYRPLYVSMTYGAGGTSRERTQDAVSLLLKQNDLEVMPHLTCIGAQESEITSILESYKQQGIDNIMALRGDPPQDSAGFDFSCRDFSCARDLVAQIKEFGHFSVGVAVYPEAHIESESLDADMEFTKLKISAGADFAVTQMFFDNSYFFSFLERLKKQKIEIPVLPGILPLTDVLKVKQFASVCRATIPEYIEEKMEKYRDNPSDMEKAGLDFTIAQCRDLIEKGIKKIHFFTLNKPQVMDKILSAL